MLHIVSYIFLQILTNIYRDAACALQNNLEKKGSHYCFPSKLVLLLLIMLILLSNSSSTNVILLSTSSLQNFLQITYFWLFSYKLSCHENRWNLLHKISVHKIVFLLPFVSTYDIKKYANFVTCFVHTPIWCKTFTFLLQCVHQCTVLNW